ncbi:MAG: AraC family transcriptional regulator [Lachnospiraceae bacterium]
MNLYQYEIYHETKKHTPENFPYNTYLCTIPLDFPEIPAHWHEEIELIVIQRGTGIVTVNLEPYEVEAGDIVFVLPGHLHSIECKEDAVMEYENILFKTELMRSMGDDYCNREFFQPMLAGLVNFPPLLHPKLPCYENIASCIRAIDDVCSKRPYGYHLAIKSYLFQIFYTLFRYYPVSEFHAKESKSLEKLKVVLTYIRENYSHPITIEEIAGECFYSKSYFMKFFKESMGTGFIQFLNDYRLNVASRLLMETDESILEIAEKTGFDNLSYFTRLFKRRYGVTPGQYRK